MISAMVLELEALHSQIHRILQSRAFRTSEVQRNLLSYLAEKSISGNADALKEYVVGLDVFAKPATYDPRQESTVRMHVARLRQKLAEYYRFEGADDPIIVDLPKGGFKVTFEPRAIEIPPAFSPPPVVEVAAPRYRREMILAGACAVAIVCALFFGARLWKMQRTSTPETANWTPELKELWAPILSSNRPLVICLSTVSSASTVFGTASGAFRLGQFLGGRKHDIQLTPSDQLSMPEIAMGNVVFVGPSTGSRTIKAVPMDQQLVLENNGIRNLKPRLGEPVFLADRPPLDPQDSADSYALVSHVPGLVGNGELLYFSGNQIPAVAGAVQAFTDAGFAKTLVTNMRKTDGTLPHFYQLVLKVRSMDDMPIDFAYVFLRELSPGKTPPIPPIPR
ncbi:MAG: hypothetical protein JO307_28220 [Bryobacterales bacterium]|nr:hypothetical protein [Bryobacterales bacterium]MBV9402034.1 hypothetical protein [Bryobacterales bacterium]